MTVAIATLLRSAQIRLAEVSDTPRLEAEVLLSSALAKPRSYLYAWPEQTPTPAQRVDFSVLLERRLAGEPVAYLIGQREFWSLELVVTAATLIPRPETERVVELALQRLPLDCPMDIADLGTGSGAIALAIAHERPRLQVIATDSSAAALAVAALNARRLRLDNVVFRQGNWCEALGEQKLAMIVCNPPYVAADDPHLRQGDLRFEPPAALVAGRDGLDAIRCIAAQAGSHLHRGGWLLVEHGHDQGERVAMLLHEQGFTAIENHLDRAGVSRVVSARSA